MADLTARLPTIEEALGPTDPDCKLCEGTGWICEAHPRRPFEHRIIFNVGPWCAGPGMPCPTCRNDLTLTASSHTERA